MSTTSFSALGVSGPLNAALSKQGITRPFPIQEASVPDAIAGQDISGKAPTGSGKTFAFGLPVLQRVEKASPNRPAALILAPTRELAGQIKAELQPLGRSVGITVAAVHGGVPYGPQKQALRRGLDVLVATPGRLEDLIDQSAVDLGQVKIVVVDEADRMADMGFLPAVRRILDLTSTGRQTMLFSATLDGEVAALTKRYQTNPVVHEARAVETTAPEASHHFWSVRHEERIDRTAVAIEGSAKTIVFTRTRHGADRLARQLGKRGIDVVAMHGGRNQNQRRRALKAFSNGQAVALIATDVAARGIHVDDVSTVIHFDPAQDSKDYVHRSGRTARAGAGGTVVSMVMPEQQKAVARLQRDLNMKVGLSGSGPLEPSSRPAQPKRPGTPSGRAGGESRRLFVGNLPWKASEKDLYDLFSAHGHVLDTEIARRKGKSRGYGFVDMAEHQVPAALRALAQTELAGRRLHVRYAR